MLLSYLIVVLCCFQLIEISQHAAIVHYSCFQQSDLVVLVFKYCNCAIFPLQFLCLYSLQDALSFVMGRKAEHIPLKIYIKIVAHISTESSLLMPAAEGDLSTESSL